MSEARSRFLGVAPSSSRRLRQSFWHLLKRQGRLIRTRSAGSGALREFLLKHLHEMGFERFPEMLEQFPAGDRESSKLYRQVLLEERQRLLRYCEKLPPAERKLWASDEARARRNLAKTRRRTTARVRRAPSCRRRSRPRRRSRSTRSRTDPGGSSDPDPDPDLARLAILGAGGSDV